MCGKSFSGPQSHSAGAGFRRHGPRPPSAKSWGPALPLPGAVVLRASDAWSQPVPSGLGVTRRAQGCFWRGRHPHQAALPRSWVTTPLPRAAQACAVGAHQRPTPEHTLPPLCPHCVTVTGSVAPPSRGCPQGRQGLAQLWTDRRTGVKWLPASGPV